MHTGHIFSMYNVSKYIHYEFESMYYLTKLSYVLVTVPGIPHKRGFIKFLQESFIAARSTEPS